MESIRTRLRANPVLTQLPLGSAKNLFGVIDLIRLEEIVWDADSLGSKYERRPVDREGSAYEIVREARVALIEAVAELDDQLMEFIFSSSDPSFLDVTPDMLTAAIRRVTLANKAVPVFLGSSLRNIGVQPVMDAVVDFLPSPLEREMPIAFKPTLTLDSEEEVDMERKLVGSDSNSAGTSSNTTATSEAKKEASGGIQAGTTFQLKCDPKAPLVGQAFKVVHEARSNSLVVYVRIYAGSMTSGMKLMNTTRGKEERSLRLTRVRAERYEDLKELQAGDIGAVTGLKNTSTGDTLVGQKDPQLCVKGMNIPEPVFFMSILADSASEEDHLKTSLGLLQLEDPSFKWMINKETGQWLLCGMGELHLEVIKDRLFNYYKVKAATGDIQIAYKSTIKDDVTEHLIKSYTVGGRSEDVNLTVELESLDIGEGSSFEIDESVMHGLSNFKKVRADLTAAFQEAAQDMFRSGVPAGYPLLDTKITLSSLAYSPSTSTHTYKLALMEAIFIAARSTGVQILEPIMKVEIEVNDEFSGGVISDLSSKRNGIIGHVTHHGGSQKKLIQAHVPLKDLLGYSTDLRSLSKGTGAMIMEFAHNGPLTDSQQTKLLGTTYFNG
jgi:elongation factor G